MIRKLRRWLMGIKEGDDEEEAEEEEGMGEGETEANERRLNEK